jgi:RimJ/RimL family protein N-acetyltransferase
MILVEAARLDAAASPWGAPAIRWHIVLAAGAVAGTISLRLGHWFHLTHLAGQAGFAVEPAFRGRGLAGAALGAVLPHAAQAGLGTLWLTTTPPNAAAQRVFGKLGARFVERVAIPPDYPSHATGERTKLRYALATNPR